ncbi:MAG: hypothetical protein ACXABY_35185 [Candidatus Thorarchaeota archaeon]|jgi:hypothetical protein
MAFNEDQKAALGNLSQNIGGILQDRFHKSQFDDFMQGDYAEYRSAIVGLQNNMVQNPDKPDIISQSLSEYSQATAQMMTNAAKYQNNPYVANLAQMHMQNDMQNLDNIVGAFQKSGALAQAGEDRAMQVEGHQAKVGLIGAQTEEAQAHAEAYRRAPAPGAGRGMTEAERRRNPLTAGAQTGQEAFMLVRRGLNEPEMQERMSAIASQRAALRISNLSREQQSEIFGIRTRSP